MMALVLANDVRFSEEIYRTACQNAVDISDANRVHLLLAAADHYVPQLSPSFHGEIASYAHSDHCYIAKEIIKRCGEEQIAAAPSRLLEQFAADHDHRTLMKTFLHCPRWWRKESPEVPTPGGRCTC